MPSGDVRDHHAKSRPQLRRALWQAGQLPSAPRLGVGGPAPGVGGAGATSGPDVSPQPHPGGAGYRRRRPRGAARAEGAGSPERASEERRGRVPAPGEGGVTDCRDGRHWSNPACCGICPGRGGISVIQGSAPETATKGHFPEGHIEDDRS
ncbi:PREDICTED: homeobox protein cut-like 1 [Cercocebus atys]|uniref:homeobox protein cut-like 1 n=1 Tax=Cercocebus atys TaxID=9531 RepID=UPI0005F4A85A|nr:PREDICTED: homeobox protein cut-like 1 [Cercocebus atys]